MSANKSQKEKPTICDEQKKSEYTNDSAEIDSNIRKYYKLKNAPYANCWVFVFVADPNEMVIVSTFS